jgi:hypothetical protein
VNEDAGSFGGLAPDAYCTNDLAFGLSDQRWADRTVHKLMMPGGGERPCELAVERARIRAGDDLDTLVTAWLRRDARSKRGHEIIRRTSREIAGRPGIDVVVRWSAEPGMIYLREAHLLTTELWLAFMVSGWWEDAGICDRHLERLLATLQLRG